jgi:gluconate 5-dehydrogenase
LRIETLAMSSRNLFDVAGKIVLITGSSRGLGFVLAAGFAEAGARVIINGTRAEGVRSAVDRIRHRGGDAAAGKFPGLRRELNLLG